MGHDRGVGGPDLHGPSPVALLGPAGGGKGRVPKKLRQARAMHASSWAALSGRYAKALVRSILALHWALLPGPPPSEWGPFPGGHLTPSGIHGLSGHNMTLAGLEPEIVGSENQRLIH